METLPVSTVRNRLNELIDSVSSTDEQVVITRNGSPAAVLVSADFWFAVEETLYWRSVDGILDDVSKARQELEDGEVIELERVLGR